MMVDELQTYEQASQTHVREVLGGDLRRARAGGDSASEGKRGGRTEKCRGGA